MTNVLDLPEDHWLRIAHRQTSHHRDVVNASHICGCFYCQKTFAPADVTVWVDESSTALCPHCGIDSVIGDASGFDITAEFLREMHAAWFSARPG